MARLPTVSSLFDSGVYVFSKEWKHLVSVVVLLSLPLYILSIGVETNPNLILPYLILSVIIGPLISVITTAIVYYRYDMDKTIHSKGLYAIIHEKFFAVLWTSILVSIVVILSMVLLAIPLAVLGIIYLIAKPALIVAGTLTSFGVISVIILSLCAMIIGVGAAIYMMFSVPITVLEKKFGLRAINKSISLVRGRWWNIFGRVFILQLIALVIAMIISLFAGAILGFDALGSLITSLLQQVAILPITIAFIVFYLDIRGEKQKKNPVAVEITTSQDGKSTRVTSAKKKTTRKKTTKKTTTKKASKKKVAKKKSTKR